jgi:predicted RNase H-like HicB family nuclease
VAKYTVRYDRDESGAWIARVRGVPEAHTYGRTIEQARERVREALSLWRDNAETAEFVDDVHLPAKALELVTAFVEARSRAAAEQLRAQRSAQAAAAALTERWNYSLRDAGELLGVSRQRVQQIRESKIGARDKAGAWAAGRQTGLVKRTIARELSHAGRSGLAAKRKA